MWAKPRIGKVTIGEIEEIGKPSRIPETAPEVDAPAPEAPVPEAPGR